MMSEQLGAGFIYYADVFEHILRWPVYKDIKEFKAFFQMSVRTLLDYSSVDPRADYIVRLRLEKRHYQTLVKSDRDTLMSTFLDFDEAESDLIAFYMSSSQNNIRWEEYEEFDCESSDYEEEGWASLYERSLIFLPRSVMYSNATAKNFRGHLSSGLSFKEPKPITIQFDEAFMSVNTRVLGCSKVNLRQGYMVYSPVSSALIASSDSLSLYVKDYIFIPVSPWRNSIRHPHINRIFNANYDIWEFDVQELDARVPTARMVDTILRLESEEKYFPPHHFPVTSGSSMKAGNVVSSFFVILGVPSVGIYPPAEAAVRITWSVTCAPIGYFIALNIGQPWLAFVCKQRDIIRSMFALYAKAISSSRVSIPGKPFTLPSNWHDDRTKGQRLKEVVYENQPANFDSNV